MSYPLFRCGPEDAGQGLAAMHAMLGDARTPHPRFAPPFMEDGDLLVRQTAAILHYLAPQVTPSRLAPRTMTFMESLLDAK